MELKRLRKEVKRFLKASKSRSLLLFIAIILLCIGAISYANYMQNRRLNVDPATYKPLLTVIGTVESKNNYNAYFGNATNTEIDFTNMSLREVLEWQQKHVNSGNFSSAVGKYQIINTTLRELIEQRNFDLSQKFNKETQDSLAIALLERRGSESYVNHEITREQFAANLAKEWAALPKVIGDNPNDSYYSGDGVNKALINTQQVLTAIDNISPK